MRKKWGQCATVLLIAVSIAKPGFAQHAFRPRIGTAIIHTGAKTFASLTVNDHIVATLRSSAGKLRPQERVQAIAQQLANAVDAGLLPGEIVPKAVAPKTWGITAGRTVLLTVTQNEAAAQHTTPEKLARQWTRSLQIRLSEPPFLLSSNHLVIPVGETRTLTIAGAIRAADVTAKDENPQITQARYSPGGRTLTVKGMAPGQTAIALSSAADGGAAAEIPVAVMNYAAQVSPDVTVSVTGDPAAPQEAIVHAAYIGLARAVDAQDGAGIRLLQAPQFPASLPVGGQITVHIPLRFSGENLLPVQTETAVTIVNQSVTPRAAESLFYSNNPEVLKHEQQLFVGKLSPFKPVRLDYHHQNASGAPLIFHADLINSSNRPAQVQVIAGIATPGSDTFQVGRRAGAAFLRNITGNIGVIIDIPAHARIPLITQRFVDGLTVSGLLQTQQLLGEANALTMSVAADSANQGSFSPLARILLSAVGDHAVTAQIDDLSPAEDNSLHSQSPSPFIFQSPQFYLNSAYAVGGRWCYLRLGHRDSLRDTTGAMTLFGNYGALYNYTLTLTNPTAAPQVVGFFFAPEAGIAAGVFQIDGRLFEFSPTYPPNEPEITRYTLAPGQTQTVHLQTIPLNGSFYPASVIVHNL